MSERLRLNEARLVFEQDHLDEAFFSMAGGRVALYSSRSPAKETPNEDAACLVATGDESGVLAVADGLGGAPAGQQASSVAVQCLASAVLDAVKDGLDLRVGIMDGFEKANQEVLALGVGAATTLTVAEVDGRSVRPYHVGDSFVLITGNRGKVKLQTIPHSPVGYGVESGLLDEEEAMYHEERHVISNVIGSVDMRIDVGSPIELALRDTLLLASDGLSDNLHSDEIIQFVRRGRLEKVARALAREVRDRMESRGTSLPSKPDDLTFLLFRLSR